MPGIRSCTKHLLRFRHLKERDGPPIKARESGIISCISSAERFITQGSSCPRLDAARILDLEALRALSLSSPPQADSLIVLLDRSASGPEGCGAYLFDFFIAF